MTALAAVLGHPERVTPVVHVAGTNGKGSVSAMLDAILHAAGWHNNPAIASVRTPKKPHKLPRPLFEKQALSVISVEGDDWISTRDRGLWHVAGGSARQYATGQVRALLQHSDGSVWATGAGLGGGVWRLAH